MTAKSDPALELERDLLAPDVAFGPMTGLSRRVANLAPGVTLTTTSDYRAGWRESRLDCILSEAKAPA